MTSKKEEEFEQIYDGEWITPVKKGFKDQCCDCLLIHTMEFRIKDGKVQFRCWREDKETAVARRKGTPKKC